MNNERLTVADYILCFLVVVAITASSLIAGTESSPTGVNLLKRIGLPSPVQESRTPYKGALGVVKTLDNSAGVTLAKISTIYGTTFPSGTNKLGIKSDYALNYGGSTITEGAAVGNLIISANTMTIFRGTKTELENMYIGIATATPATASVYFFPYQE